MVLVFQVIGALMVISPAPSALAIPGPDQPLAVVCSVTPVPPFRVFWMVLAAASSTVKSVGSKSQVPGRPRVALAVTLAVSTSRLCPEVSIRPPSPPVLPPFALAVPRNVVFWELTTICPPLPDWPADAFRLLLASTETDAVAASPTTMEPPPVAPWAFSVAPASVIGPLAERAIWPPVEVRLEASMMPVLLMAPPYSLSAASAVSRTLPLSARRIPPFLIRLSTAAGSTCRLTRRSPARVSVTLSPEARATVPRVASISPLLVTFGEIKAAYLSAWMLPLLTILPVASPRWNCRWSARKSLSVTFKVEATRPPTFTVEPAPKTTPLGLIRITCPLADNLPRITLGLAAMTRLRAMDPASGWLKTTDSPAPMSKLCQVNTAFGVDCWIVIAVSVCEMRALPTVT